MQQTPQQTAHMRGGHSPDARPGSEHVPAGERAERQGQAQARRCSGIAQGSAQQQGQAAQGPPGEGTRSGGALTIRAPSPTYFCTSSLPITRMKQASVRLATARASSVLPARPRRGKGPSACGIAWEGLWTNAALRRPPPARPQQEQ